MSRLAVLAVLALSRIAAADPGANLVEVDAEVLVSPLDPSLGGSLHYEHRFADSELGITLRAGAATGEVIVDDPGSFVEVAGLVGVRQHWGGRYHFEAALGAALGRRAPSLDDNDKPIYGDWEPGLAFDFELGVQLGPVALGVYAGAVGLGIRIGVPFEI